MLSTSRVARLDAKYDTIKLALGVKRSSTYSGDDGSDCSEKLKRRKRIGQRMTSAVRLFGGSIEEYLEVNKVEIPLIIKSCVRVVNLFGKLLSERFVCLSVQKNSSCWSSTP